MRIYFIEQSETYQEFAQFAALGTWSEGSLCKECGATSSRRIEPLQIEWTPGSDRIGDFSWSSFTFAITTHVAAILKANKFECDYLNVEMKPTNKSRRQSEPCVSLPYKGPPLCWARALHTVELDEHKSGVSVKSRCDTCGRVRYNLKRQGLVASALSWNKRLIFRFRQFEPSAATFVSEAARDIMLSHQFTNISFQPAGEIE